MPKPRPPWSGLLDAAGEILCLSLSQARTHSRAATGRRWRAVLLRLAYLDVTNAFAMLRLLPLSDGAKDTKILVLRYQLMVLERQLHGQRVRFLPAERAFLAALLYRLPRDVVPRVRLLVRPAPFE